MGNASSAIFFFMAWRNTGDTDLPLDLSLDNHITDNLFENPRPRARQLVGLVIGCQ